MSSEPPSRSDPVRFSPSGSQDPAVVNPPVPVQETTRRARARTRQMGFELHLRDLLSLILIISFRLPFRVLGEEGLPESVPDLQNKMYTVLDGYPCVRLLNISGEIGCANPSLVKVTAPIVRFKIGAFKLDSPSAVLVLQNDMQDFFKRLHADVYLAKNIAGVLIQSNDEYSYGTSGFSPVGKFPQADFAPYKNITYDWNPVGSGLMWNRYDFPVFLLSEDSSSKLEQISRKTKKYDDKFQVDVAEFDVIMQTTKSGSHNSEACLKDRSCLPLGGYSILSSLPPINASSQKAKPMILAMAGQDSASFFRDKTVGADSHLSGMIALLVAVDALSAVDVGNEFEKQLVFIFFTGEAWGYLGSRRFIHELDAGSDSIKGLNYSMIEKVLEVGSVGKSFSEEESTFFTHVAENSSAAKEIIDALGTAAASLKSEKIVIKSTSSSNPGIPPSSLMTFLNKNSSIAGLVLEEFDSVFSNEFYYSHPDGPSNINVSSIVSAAAVVARALYILATNVSNSNSSMLNSINVNGSLVEELVGCLLNCKPGLSCSLVRKYIAPTEVCPNHYVGVLVDPPTSTPSMQNMGDTSRFIWNFLADRTSNQISSTNSSCLHDCTHPNEVCVAAETGKGVCKSATARYVPAYSTRLKHEAGWWSMVSANDGDPMGKVDPVWTESFWNTLGLRVYKVQSEAYNQVILWVGILVTIFSYMFTIAAKVALRKSLKRD